MSGGKTLTDQFSRVRWVRRQSLESSNTEPSPQSFPEKIIYFLVEVRGKLISGVDYRFISRIKCKSSKNLFETLYRLSSLMSLLGFFCQKFIPHILFSKSFNELILSFFPVFFYLESSQEFLQFFFVFVLAFILFIYFPSNFQNYLFHYFQTFLLFFFPQ